LDGRYLPPRFHLSLLLEHFANIVPLELSSIPTAEIAEDPLLPPLDPLHEVWASEVTYPRSLETRKAVSEAADVYDKAYSAERPELFLKVKEILSKVVDWFRSRGVLLLASLNQLSIDEHSSGPHQ
jgi:2-dehydro-3-deoxy-D-arabinonate dehydratase